MTLNIKKAGLEMVERANSSEEQVFGSFYLSRLLGLNISFKNNKCFVAFNSIPTYYLIHKAPFTEVLFLH